MFPGLVLVRHGQSTWNHQNRFTGWEDPPLSDSGRVEAQKTAQLLITAGITFDAVFTSYLRRAIETMWLLQQQMDLMWLPTMSDWRLNERHYGALQGQNKAATARQYGAQQLHAWRRSHDVRPPLGGTAFAPDHRYTHAKIPQGENLTDTGTRVVACYEERILPLMQRQQRLLVVAHGNSLRALIMHLDKISPAAIMKLEIPTGGAIGYHTDKNGIPQSAHQIIAGDGLTDY